MDRRNFFKIVSAVSAGVATNACGRKTNALIPLLVPDHEIVPGEEQWHPTVCTECGAGCGAIARVMEGERVIERGGQKFRERIASIKKLEGNPLDPVSSGRLCARGQAAVQSLYNPDRVRGPMRRTGKRGDAAFAAVSWDEAIATVAEKLGNARTGGEGAVLFLTSAPIGTRRTTIQKFLKAVGAGPALACPVGDLAIERKAAEIAFGWKGLPRYDLANARYALAVGVDFLGGWASPVYYGRQYGHFRQGRPGMRGKLVQAESRMSLTAGSADEWLPIRPGSEPQLLIAIARVLVDEKLARGAEQLPKGVQESIAAANLDNLISATGISEKRLRRMARELGESEAPLVIAGASVVHTNSLDAVVVSHYVNSMLGNIGRAGGVFPASLNESEAAHNSNLVDEFKRARVLLLDGENPVYGLPQASGVREALERMGLIVSFGSFIDDSVAYADVILPDHHALESDQAIIQEISPDAVSVAIATSFVRPLYDTRALSETLGAIAQKTNVTFEAADAKKEFSSLLPPDASWEDAARQGGLWREEPKPAVQKKFSAEKLNWNDAVFSGDAAQFPLEFQPYLSVQYRDGRGANLPWMQELPDPASSAMWGLPVEVDPQTAAKLNIATGDRVRVESPHGSIEAPAYVHPAALTGVVSMAVGQGHAHYGRYASGRGANPLSILAPVWESATGALAFGATRVRLTRVASGGGELIQFAPQDREQGPWGYR